LGGFDSPPGTAVFRINRATRKPSNGKHSAQLLVDGITAVDGYALYLCFDESAAARLAQGKQVILLPESLSYLSDGDVITVGNDGTLVRAMYRRGSPNNSFLVTERCNHLCVMCSQPPRTDDDSFLVDEILEAIPLLDRSTREVGITGGEPTLVGDKFFDMVECMKRFLPGTGVHVLSNGRAFSDHAFSRRLAELRHFDLMVGIPLYSDYAPLHNFVVQAEGAFDETVRGIINLKALGVRVELRFVLNRYTVTRLRSFARFVARNLLFVDHVAFMGMETVGFGRTNLEDLWIDPHDYMSDLEAACLTLATAGGRPSVYNSQLCLMPKSLLPFYRHSISDWKNEYVPECESCYGRTHCGGFFASNQAAFSAHLEPFHSPESVARFLE